MIFYGVLTADVNVLSVCPGVYGYWIPSSLSFYRGIELMFLGFAKSRKVFLKQCNFMAKLVSILKISASFIESVYKNDDIEVT